MDADRSGGSSVGSGLLGEIGQQTAVRIEHMAADEAEGVSNLKMAGPVRTSGVPCRPAGKNGGSVWKIRYTRVSNFPKTQHYAAGLMNEP